MRRLLLPLLVAAVTTACLGGPPAPPLPGAPPPPPAGAPWSPTQFGIGVTAQPPDLGAGGWLTQSGVPFDYAYQYLAAGVNTGNGWQTWNVDAQFPLWYANDAETRGAIPVFPYYMLLQSTGPCDGCGEAQQDLAHLNHAPLMAAYYADFAKLMQRLGSGTYDGIAGFGGEAIVHVEPDLSGYAQQAVLDNAADCYGFCTGQGNDPSLLRASVAGSGYGPVAGYPDTFRGFNLALLHLRDLYAPNVRLAFHVSTWATGPDIGTDTRTNLDAAAEGNKAGAFAVASGAGGAPAGTSNYEIVFNDVADRDAGYYKYVLGQNRWWDRLNVTFPNFHRWEQFVGAVSATTGRKIVVWQIPLGNQSYRSVNNTDDHYQDNRAEYFFGHIGELVNAGVVALLFGRGNDGSTAQTDAHGDGVTNPAQVCTTDGVSSGQVCTTQTATVADDDGGYLRQAAGAYYGAPVDL